MSLIRCLCAMTCTVYPDRMPMVRHDDAALSHVPNNITTHVTALHNCSSIRASQALAMRLCYSCWQCLTMHSIYTFLYESLARYGPSSGAFLPSHFAIKVRLHFLQLCKDVIDACHSRLQHRHHLEPWSTDQLRSSAIFAMLLHRREPLISRVRRLLKASTFLWQRQWRLNTTCSSWVASARALLNSCSVGSATSPQQP